MPRATGGDKRPLTERQLANLAKGNPRVAQRLKEGAYKDRLGAAGAPPAKPRQRAQRAQLPPAPAPAKPAPKRKKTATTTTARTREPSRRRERPPGDSQKRPGKLQGFFQGFLGGG